MNKYLVLDIILGFIIVFMIICIVRLDKQYKARNYSKLIRYRIEEGETLHSITNGNDYIIQVIFENNKSYFDGVNHSVDHVEAGDIILVPTYE